MTDSMKFGPEWLRNLTADGCNNSGGGGGGLASSRPPRYQLADHRYGREEMLALFDRSYLPPEPLSNFSTLFVEKTQSPLALIQMTDEETRLWNGGVTSSTAAGRGRGGSVDRGGRGRIGRTNPHFRVGYEDPMMEGPRSDPIPFPVNYTSIHGRTRAFDRSTVERPWSERNGVTDQVEWNGSISPRKEAGRGLSGSLLMESNWRRHRMGEDDDAWRMNPRNDKWAKSSWRDGDRNDKGDCEDRRAVHRPMYDPHGMPIRRTRNSSGHHEFQDNLPECFFSPPRVTDHTGDSGGSFDASGAFHGIYSDDDDDRIGDNKRRQPRVRRVSEGSTLSSSKGSPVSCPGGSRYSGFVGNPNAAPIGPPGAAMRTNRAHAPDGSERPKSMHFEQQHLPDATGAERRSESPKSSLTTEDKGKMDKSDGDKSIRDGGGGINQKSAIDPKRIAPPGKLKKYGSMVDEEREKTDDPLKRLEEDVAKLIETAAGQKSGDQAGGQNNNTSSSKIIGGNSNSGTGNPGLIDGGGSGQEKWYYRDPQGEVQGPFLASEMAEWWKQGYFSPNLLVRRTYDERYATLGDLMKLCGRVPFKPGPPIPVLKITDNIMPPGTVPAGIPTPAGLSKAGMDDPILMYQYSQLHYQQNLILFKQAQCNAITKLSQSEHWSTLTPGEQNQLILQYIRSVEPDIIDPALTSPGSFMPAMTPPPPSSSVMQLFPQLQQTMKPPQDNHVPTQNLHPDPVQQLMQQMSGMRNLSQLPPHSGNPPPSAAAASEENAIKSWIRQLSINANGHQKPQPVETVWPQPPPHLAQFSPRNWMPQMNHGQPPAMPPGHMPSSLWEMHPKDMKTEQQILEEQKLKMQEEKKKLQQQQEEARKQQEELLRKKAEEELLMRQQQEEELARLKAEEAQREEERRKEEEKKRKEEEKRKQREEEERLILEAEKKRKEEEQRKREEKRKHDEELNKKKQEEEKKKRDEQKRVEEKLKKEEEKRRKLEEEQKRKEEERLKKEEEARKKAEAEENTRKAEQRRREVEALKKLQERSKAPWAQASPAQPTNAQASLADIQRFEREKKAEEQRVQLLLQQQQLAQQRAAEANAEALALDSSKRLQFKWAEKLAAATTATPQIKSLAQIQLEEQEKMSKVKQQERERQEKEKISQKDNNVFVAQNVNIWGTASQSLSWSNPAMPQGGWTIAGSGGGGGFWEEPLAKSPNAAPALLQQKSPQKAAVMPIAKQATGNQQASPQQQSNNSNKSGKSKSKKEEELVKKLFEQNTAKTDDFTQWCTKALSGLQVSVDIPTFIGFLRDIEAAYEVKEYVRLYLGEGKQCAEFAKQFLEKRSKWRSLQRPQAQADDLCKPAPAVNPNASTDFQEVKSKSKKPKKGKMCKIDSRMLGFNVMSAPDRINVGDRDYGDGV